MLTDYLGNPLEVGDIVACVVPQSKRICRAEIIKLHRKEVGVRFLDHRTYYKEISRPTDNVILIQKKAVD